jgi:hypothetical protein
MLAMNIAGRSFAGLARPLDFDQVAPVPFLWLVKVVVSVAGTGESAWRLVSLLAGIVALALVWRLASVVLGPRGGLVALALAAVSPALLYYSDELKPYTLDAAVTAAVSLLVLRLERDPTNVRVWIALLVAGIVALAASIPAVFVLAAAVLGLALLQPFRGTPQARRWALACAVVWAAAAVTLYVVFYAPVAARDSMREFWTGSYLGRQPFPRLVALVLAPFLATFAGGTSMDGTRTLGGAAAALAGAALAVCWDLGVARAGRRATLLAALLAGPLLVMALASMAGAFPLAPRLMVFAAPLLVIVLAGGIEAIAEGLGRFRLPVLAVLTLAAVAAALAPDIGWGLTANRWAESRRVVDTWRREVRPGDATYVLATGTPVWAYYTTDWARPDTTRLRWIRDVAGPGRPGFANVSGAGRVRAGEAKALERSSPRGTELLGLGTGRQWRNATGFSQALPDTGWAQEEADRIQSAPGDVAWICVLQAVDQSDALLRWELKARGARLEEAHRLLRAALYRYRFPAGGSGVSESRPSS